MSKKNTLREGDTRKNPKTGVKEVYTPEGVWQPKSPTGEITTEQIAQAWKQRPDLQKEFATVGAKGKSADWTIYDWARQYGTKEMPEIFGSLESGQKQMGLDDVSDNKSADQYINQNQEKDFNIKAAEDGPEVKSEKEKADPFAEIKAVITGGEKAPERTSLLDTYKKEREARGITDLESQINDYDKKIADLQALIREEKNKIGKEGISARARAGRLTEYARDVQEQIDYYEREKQYAVNELNTKNAVLSTIMNLTQADYQTAKDLYDTKFTQNIQLQNLLNAQQERQLTREEKAKDNARANLQILANALSKGSVDFTSLSPDQQATINKLELQAGFPIGFTSYIKSTNPKSDIISTSSRTDNSGNKFVDIVMRDQDTGQVKVESKYLGTEQTTKSTVTSGNLTITREDIGEGETELNQSRGDDGYSSTALYLEMLKYWTDNGGQMKDFLKHYPARQYLNPSDSSVPAYLKQYLKEGDSDEDLYQ